MVGFWVQRIGDMVMSPETQMLQPMHSRMSSIRPCSILRGRKGSAIEGRAAPIRSSTPRLIWATIASGEVKRPTPTTGLPVSCLMPVTKGSCAPSSPKREVCESFDQSDKVTSQRSGSSAKSPIMSWTSARWRPSGPSSSSTERRTATAQVSPTASLASSISSRTIRTRFSRLPPYSSLRSL